MTGDGAARWALLGVVGVSGSQGGALAWKNIRAFGPS